MTHSRLQRCLSNESLARIYAELGDAVIISEPERVVPFGKDGTVGSFAMPDLVVEVKRTEQVQVLLRLANAYGFPVIPRGLGTGLAGGAVPVQGGVVLSLAGMNRILGIETENMIAVVEPGF
jgi:FAD/FMN-containing dehydrogenase